MPKSSFLPLVRFFWWLTVAFVAGCAVSAIEADVTYLDASSSPVSPTPDDAGGADLLDAASPMTPEPASECSYGGVEVDAGPCGCGVAVIDSDSDSVPDCKDKCPMDPNKVGPGLCGCGVAETPGVPCEAAEVPESGCKYVTFEERSYYVCMTPRSYEVARELCAEVGLDLVVVGSAAENAFVQQQIGPGKQGWLGYSDARVEGIFRWVDGSEGTYLNFASGEPNSRDEDCVEILGDSGLWNDKNCANQNPYVCEQVDAVCTASGAEICDGIDNDCDGSIDVGVCPAGCTAVSHDGRVYTVCSTERTWLLARDACVALGASLVRVRNADDNAFVRLLARSINRDDVWLGGNDRDVEGVWRWVDDGTQFWQGAQASAGGTPQNGLYNAWNPGEPNSSGDEDCIITQGNGEWRDGSCNDSKPYVCAK